MHASPKRCQSTARGPDYNLEAFWVLLLSLEHGGSADEGRIFVAAIVGGPVIAILFTQALFWIVDGFR